MAADGLVTGQGLIHGDDVAKIRRLGDGRIAGATGSFYAQAPFFDWLESGGEPPELPEEFEGIVLRPDGTCSTYNRKCYSCPQSVPSASGSGSAIALGAMEAGASPKLAVEIACRRDTESGGNVMVLHLAEPSLAAVKAA